MIPLASDLLPFPDQMRREGHLKSASLPGRLSSSGRMAIVDSFIELSRGTRRVSCEFHVDNLGLTTPRVGRSRFSSTVSWCAASRIRIWDCLVRIVGATRIEAEEFRSAKRARQKCSKTAQL